jgi:hypothetical protein
MIVTVLAMVGFLAPLLSPTSAYADDGNHFVRITQPKSTYNKTSMKLGFVALDVNGNDSTVSCYVETPSSAFTLFDTVVAEGNGNCEVDSSILSEEGEYKFYVKAEVSGDEVTSDIVTMELDLTGPSPVVDYTKEAIACGNVLNFTTAADSGETTKVEIYRSTETTFEANSTTRIVTLTVGSDETVEYTDAPLPDCNDEYFYAIRAFDTASNTSAFTTDTLVVVTTPPAENVGTETTEEGGEVLGEGETPEGENGDVKGDEDDKDADTDGTDKTSVEEFFEGGFWGWFRYVLLAVLLAILGWYGYAFYQTRKSRSTLE